MHITTIGCEKSGGLLLARLLLLSHATPRASDSLQNMSFVESLRDIVFAFQILMKWLERPYGSVMYKVPCQGLAHTRTVRAHERCNQAVII
jgi:hypothetical protein